MLKLMPRPSAIHEGFRTALHRPSLVVAEIAWRWSFGLAVGAMLVFVFLVYLKTLPVSDADLFLLRTKAPPLMAEALRDILRGSGPRLLRAFAVLLPAVSILWIAAASLGRWASLRALIADPRGRFATILGLHFLRAAAALAAAAGYLGALFVAAYLASRSDQDRPGLFLLVFFVLASVIGLIHGRLRWYLFLANLFAVRDGSEVFSSIAAGFDAYRERRARFLSLAAAMWALRLLALMLATVASLLPLVGLDYVHWKPVTAALVIITLAYFLAADFLFVVRLAAYLEILRDEPAPEAGSPVPPTPVPADSPTTHDLRPAADQLEASS